MGAACGCGCGSAAGGFPAGAGALCSSRCKDSKNSKQENVDFNIAVPAKPPMLHKPRFAQHQRYARACANLRC